MKKQVSIILFMIIILFCFVEHVSANDNLLSTTTKDKVMFIKDYNGKFYYSELLSEHKLRIGERNATNSN